jgi:hypothetical protein
VERRAKRGIRASVSKVWNRFKGLILRRMLVGGEYKVKRETPGEQSQKWNCSKFKEVQGRRIDLLACKKE